MQLIRLDGLFRAARVLTYAAASLRKGGLLRIRASQSERLSVNAGSINRRANLYIFNTQYLHTRARMGGWPRNVKD